MKGCIKLVKERLFRCSSPLGATRVRLVGLQRTSYGTVVNASGLRQLWSWPCSSLGTPCSRSVLQAFASNGSFINMVRSAWIKSERSSGRVVENVSAALAVDLPRLTSPRRYSTTSRNILAKSLAKGMFIAKIGYTHLKDALVTAVGDLCQGGGKSSRNRAERHGELARENVGQRPTSRPQESQR
jgi:hypothetical protein